MIVITDSNILFSALLTPKGIIAEILNTEQQIQFLAPNFLIEEVKNHLQKISKYRKVQPAKILQELNKLLQNVDIIDVAKIPKSCVVDALEIVKDIDPDDVFFVALHLFVKHKIWTTDKNLIIGLQNKGLNFCVTTEEVKLRTYKK